MELDLFCQLFALLFYFFLFKQLINPNINFKNFDPMSPLNKSSKTLIKKAARIALKIVVPGVGKSASTLQFFDNHFVEEFDN